LAHSNVPRFKTVCPKHSPEQPVLKQTVPRTVGHTVDSRHTFCSFVVDLLIDDFCGGYVTTFPETHTNAWTKNPTNWTTRAWWDIYFSQRCLVDFMDRYT
jgi:hypothetical protein